MLTLTTDQLNTLRYGPAALFTCVDLHIDDGPYYFWDGPEAATIDAKAYLSLGGYAGVSTVIHGADLGSSAVDLILDASRLLSASNNPSDPANWLATVISNGGYRQRRMYMFYSIWNASTGVHVLQRRAMSGVIDQMRIRYDPDANSGKGSAKLVVRCEDISLRYGQRLGRLRNHEDQREIDPTDDFFKMTAGAIIRERTLQWGRAGEGSQPTTGGGGVLGGGVLNRWTTNLD